MGTMATSLVLLTTPRRHNFPALDLSDQHMQKSTSVAKRWIRWGAWVRAAAVTLAFADAGAGPAAVLSTNPPAQPSSTVHPAPLLRLGVDPRVELMSLIFRLAGNPEYNQGRVESYTADVRKQFDGFANHPAVQLARELRNTRGVSYDACMSLAVLLTDPYELRTKVPLEPWPEGLDNRWRTEDVTRFLAATRQFVSETSFQKFIGQHRELYQTTESRFQELMTEEAHLEWFRDYFGDRPGATFTAVPAPLNGGSCYGPHCRDAAGNEELYCILGVWETDGQGLPVFRRNMLDTVIHEFCHSYANPIIDRHRAELEAPGRLLFAPVAEEMRSQAYGEPITLLRESLVRGCVIRYVRQYQGGQAANRAIREEKSCSFLWMEELSNTLGEYERHRDQYPTLETFSPRLVAFFTDYAAKFAVTQRELDSKAPKVVSVNPADGAADVDPALGEIRVVFDRPMVDHSWSMVGGGPHFPETTGKPYYDERLTTWTIPVKLKPDWDYQFMLNSGRFDSFRSKDNVPLKPVSVKFRTAKANGG